MANHKSAEKATRQTLKRTARNKTVRTKVKGAIKELKAAVQSGDAAKTKQALTKAQSEFGKSVSKGVIKKQTAARSVSRLTKAAKKVIA
jgi:small subunit ribosomal protein S20